MRTLFMVFIGLATLSACAGRTAQDLPVAQRTPQGVFSEICSRCHGEQGQSKAFGVSQVISDMSQAEIEHALRGYRDGEYGGAFKGIMQDQAESLTEQEIQALAAYVSALGG